MVSLVAIPIPHLVAPLVFERCFANKGSYRTKREPTFLHEQRTIGMRGDDN
jgi:hypothetical protein